MTVQAFSLLLAEYDQLMADFWVLAAKQAEPMNPAQRVQHIAKLRDHRLLLLNHRLAHYWAKTLPLS